MCSCNGCRIRSADRLHEAPLETSMGEVGSRGSFTELVTRSQWPPPRRAVVNCLLFRPVLVFVSRCLMLKIGIIYMIHQFSVLQGQQQCGCLETMKCKIRPPCMLLICGTPPTARPCRSSSSQNEAWLLSCCGSYWTAWPGTLHVPCHLHGTCHLHGPRVPAGE